MEDSQLKLVPLSSDTTEYKDVIRNFAIFSNSRVISVGVFELSACLGFS